MEQVTAAAPIKHTTRPIVTGTSVLGIVYDGGVMLAADTLLSYGGMAKHQGVSRMQTVQNTVIAASGEFSDFQQLQKLLEQKCLEETQTSLTLMDSLYADHSNTLSAVTVWNYLRFIFYQKRNKFNPYWNDLLIAGLDSAGKPFLGSVDKIGTTVTDHVLATGFGSYLALPLLREQWRPDLTEGEARAILEDCCKVLFYRDCRASSQIQLAKCGVPGQAPLVSAPYQLDTDWSDPAFVSAAPAGLDGDGGW